MKTAKEMFEELGYELDNDYSERTNCLYYKKKQDRGYERIIFNFSWRKVKVDFMTFKYVCDPKYLSYEELQAINKQVEELGWLDE